VIRGRASTLSRARLRGGTDVAPFDAEGRAPAVLVFHGFTGTTSEVRPLLDAIAREGLAVRAPILPGHGTSPCDLQGSSFDAWAEAMDTELTRARERSGAKVVVCGFSLGSLVAMHLAAARPGDVAGLVALGNALTLTAASRVPLGLIDRLGVAIPDWYLMKPFAVDMTDRAAAARVTTYDRHPLRAALEVYRAGARVRAEVARITCPTLVVHGARDRVCGVENAAWLAAHVGATDVTVRVYPRSAHAVAADVDRDAVARETLAFIDRVATTPPR